MFNIEEKLKKLISKAITSNKTLQLQPVFYGGCSGSSCSGQCIMSCGTTCDNSCRDTCRAAGEGRNGGWCSMCG